MYPVYKRLILPEGIPQMYVRLQQNKKNVFTFDARKDTSLTSDHAKYCNSHVFIYFLFISQVELLFNYIRTYVNELLLYGWTPIYLRYTYTYIRIK